MILKRGFLMSGMNFSKTMTYLRRLSLSQIDNYLLEQEPVCNSQLIELPSAELATVQAINLDDVV